MSSAWPLAPLPWQADHWSRLAELLDADRLPHALMLNGEAGCGKRWLLDAFTARLLCAAPVSGTACGECKSCRLLQAGSHSDLMILEPEEGGRLIKIEQVRKLITFASKTPGLGMRKVILIAPAEAMNINAANALLKCLEEPSVSTTMLLLTHNVSALPATIRSRCQLINIASPKPVDSIAWLSSIVGDAKQAQHALTVAGGRPLLAASLFLENTLEDVERARKSVQALFSGSLSPLEMPALVQSLPLEEVLAFMQEGLEVVLKDRSGPAAGRKVALLFELRDDLARKRRAILAGANPNRQLIIEDYSARMTQAFLHLSI